MTVTADADVTSGALDRAAYESLTQRVLDAFPGLSTVAITLREMNDHKKLLGLINDLQRAVYYHMGESYERKALKELASQQAQSQTTTLGDLLAEKLAQKAESEE